MDIITIYGREHVVIINGIAFELDPAMFDPCVRKIEWAAGRGVVYWEDGRENTTFGQEGFDRLIAPLVTAFGKAQKDVEDNVVILGGDQHKKHNERVSQRAALLNSIREVEERLNRSTQAILAAQLSGKTPEPEDVRHFLYNYTKKLEIRAQLASIDFE